MVSAAAGRDRHGDPRARRGSPPSLSIGAVLGLLRPEFPDVSISKIRFLEDQGLIEPDRTPAGYRKFAPPDVERLRYVLGVQRDHYLPLRVIRDHLDALDRGLEPPVGTSRPAGPAGSHPNGPVSGPATGPIPVTGPRLVEPVRERERRATPRVEPDQRLTRAQLLDVAGIDDAVLADLESHGLIAARPSRLYDAQAVQVARTARELAAFGFEPRHLRAFRSAADREAGLVEQVVNPLRRQRGPESAARAEEVTREVSALCVQLHAALVNAALERGVK